MVEFLALGAMRLSSFMGETDVATMAIVKCDLDDEAFRDVSAETKD